MKKIRLTSWFISAISIFSILLSSCSSVKGLKKNEQLSPFGRLVVTNGNTIYEVNLNNELKQEVLFQGSDISEVEWMPDGNRIIFSQNVSGGKNLNMFNISSRDTSKILTTRSAQNVEPSPTGEKLLFSDVASYTEFRRGNRIFGRANYDLFIYGFQSDSVHKLKDHTPEDSTDQLNAREIGVWGPKGNKIAFYKMRMLSPHSVNNRRWGIYTSTKDGSNPKLVVQGEYIFNFDTYMTWADQSNSIIMGTFEPIPWDASISQRINSSKAGIWKFNLGNNKLELIKERDASGIFKTYTNFKNICASPSGDHLIYSKKEEVYFVDLNKKTYRVILEYENDINFDWLVE